MKAKEIAETIERFAPLDTQEKWDNAGLCIGSPDQEVHSVLVGFDCTPSLVKEAVAIGADMIVTHHPLIFSGLKQIRPEDPVGEAVILAIRHSIAIYSAHTNADKADGGVNALMAQRLGLSNAVRLGDEGLAMIGDVPQMSGEEFCRYVKERFSLNSLRCSAPVEKVSRVAVSCGSGSSFAGLAQSEGADAFVTGDVSYHHFFCPEGFMIMDVGHYESEVDIVDRFVDILTKNLHTFAVHTSANNKNNPIYYY